MSSSIFSFKKYSLFFTTIVILTLVFLTIGTEIMLKNKGLGDDDYETVRDKLWNNNKNYVVFGDSRSVNGLKEGKKLSNLAIRGNTLQTIIKMAEFYEKKNKLKGLIIQLDPHFFSPYRLYKEQKFFLDDLTQKRTTPFIFMRPQHRQYLVEHWYSLIKTKIINLFPFDIIDNKKEIKDSNILYDKNIVQIRVNTQTPVSDLNKTEIFNQLINFIDNFKKKKINLCFVSFPVNSLYVLKANKNKSFNKAFITFRNIANKKKVKYKNYFEYFSDKYFNDADHMNDLGAVEFTKLLLHDCFGEKF